MLKRLKTIIAKEQKLSTAFYNKLLESNITTKLKKSIKAYYNKQNGAQTKLLKILNLQNGGNQTVVVSGKLFTIGDKIGHGGVSISYCLCHADEGCNTYVVKKFNEKQKVSGLIENITEFETNIVSNPEYSETKRYWTYIFPRDKTNNFVVSKWCKGSLYDAINSRKLDMVEKTKLLTDGFNVLKNIHKKKCPFVHGDIKLENMLYDEKGVYIHDLDGVFVYNPETLFHVTDNPFQRECYGTPFMFHPFIIWYTMVLAGDDDKTITNLLGALRDNKNLAEGMWNMRVNTLNDDMRKIVRGTIVKLYNGTSFKDYVNKSLQSLTDVNYNEWVRANLALCDIYSYYMSIVYNINLIKENCVNVDGQNDNICKLAEEIFLFMQEELKTISQMYGGKQKNMKGGNIIKSGMDGLIETSIRYCKLERSSGSIKVAIVTELSENGITYYYKLNETKTDFVSFVDITPEEIRKLR